MSETGFPTRLIEGYENFLQQRFERERFADLAARGQRPKILVIACCDSRVAPELIFDSGPGEIFVLRNVANLAPPYLPNDDYHGASAAIEFAVQSLQVGHIVVMGHAQCGGVKAFAETCCDSSAPRQASDFVGRWIRLMAPAAARLGGPTGPLSEWSENLALESIKNSIENLRTFPYIKDREERGDLRLHGAYFGVATGKLLTLDATTGQFVQVAGDAHRAALLEGAA